MSFATLKKNSKNSLQKLQSEVEKINNPQNNQKNFGDDDRFWKAELDKSGNGYAVIRFLPDQHNEDWHSSVFSIMDFRVQAVGTSKTL